MESYNILNYGKSYDNHRGKNARKYILYKKSHINSHILDRNKLIKY